jgi:hypothetical protein
MVAMMMVFTNGLSATAVASSGEPASEGFMTSER